MLALAFLQACSHAPSSETEIVGSRRFSNQVREAMILLKTRDADAYAIVTNYVGRIEGGENQWNVGLQRPSYLRNEATSTAFSPSPGARRQLPMIRSTRSSTMIT